MELELHHGGLLADPKHDTIYSLWRVYAPPTPPSLGVPAYLHLSVVSGGVGQQFTYTIDPRLSTAALGRLGVDMGYTTSEPIERPMP